MLEDDVPVVIGGDRNCNFILADSTVAGRHVQITLHGREITVTDLGTITGTWLDDVRITAPALAGVDATIRIGETVIQLELASVAPRTTFEHQPGKLSAVEEDLVARVLANPADDATAGIYADWLENAGFPQRAAFIRLELAGGDDITHSEALAKMTMACTAQWRAIVARAEIQQCETAGCPARWHHLTPTEDAWVRRCARCRRDVSYCASLDAVRSASQAEQVVVYDARLAKWTADNTYADDLTTLIR